MKTQTVDTTGAATLRELYDSPAALREPKYRAWLTDLNFMCKCAIGCELWGPQAKIRRLYTSGLDVSSALRKLQGMRI